MSRKRLTLTVLGIVSAFFPEKVYSQNLLGNPGFEQDHRQWSNWSSAKTISSKEFHSGRKSLKTSACGKSLSCLQKNILLKGGYQYKISGWIKTADLEGNAYIGLSLYSDKKYLAGVLTPAITGNSNWQCLDKFFIAPDGVSSCQISASVSECSKGSAFFDDIALEEAGKIAGKYGRSEVRVRTATGKFGNYSEINLSNQLIELGMNEKVSGWINCFRYIPGSLKNLIPDLYLQINGIYEYHNTVKLRKVTVKEKPDGIICIINQLWPEVNIVKTIELFDDKPYVYLRYDAEVVADFKSKWFMVHLLTNKKMDSIYYNAIFKKHFFPDKQKWFGIPKTDERWIIFQDSKTGEGFAVISPDAKKWAEYPSRFLGCEFPQGGYSLSFKKWMNQELKKGDKISFNFFLYVFKDTKNPVEKTKATLRELTEGL